MVLILLNDINNPRNKNPDMNKNYSLSKNILKTFTLLPITSIFITK